MAQYILNNDAKIAFASANDVGQAVGSSAATVVRFARALGYEGYSELQEDIRSKLSNNYTASQQLAQRISDGALSDDLATVRYRSNGMQKAPLIIRTRGHRLEGIWHSGSQMGGLVHLLRGIYILVPRNMTKAVGFYNTLLKTDEPAIVIECLNGYRLKEKMPSNLTEIRTPIGVVETVKEGSDITIVSYGSTLRIVQEAAKELQQVSIDAEVIDIQSLLPLDLNHDLVKSVAKTNRLLVVDEDVPGGASAYILNEILDIQNGYQHLDSKPQALTAKQHRPAYGTDGDYFSKPSEEDIFEKVYEMMHEADPNSHPKLR